MRPEDSARFLIVRKDEELIAIPMELDGEEVTCYFVDDAEDAGAPSDASLERALSLAGAWSDLDWNEMARELDRIRHESKPTPPIEP